MKKSLLLLLITGTLGAQSFAQDSDEPIIFKTADGLRFRVIDGTSVALIPADNGYHGDFVVPSQATDESSNITYTVTALGDEAFYGSKCARISLPSTLDSITGNAFFYCTMNEFEVEAGNTHFATIDGILYTKDMTSLISFPNGKSFDGYALPESVTEIGDYAFCSVWLTEFNVPERVSRIGAGAFMDTRLKAFEVPATVTELGAGALQNCRSLKSVTFPEGMTYLPANILTNSYMIEELNLPTTLTRIGRYAFSNTFVYSYGNLISDITLPDNVTELEGGAFDGCHGLKSITLSRGLETIGLYCFARCSNLSEIVSPNSVPPTCLGMADEGPDVTGAFYDVPEACIVYVPASSVDAYKEAWGEKFTDIRPMESDGIDSVVYDDALFDITVADGELKIVSSWPVAVHEVSGRKVATAEAGVSTIAVDPGVYIITSGAQATKVIVP